MTLLRAPTVVHSPVPSVVVIRTRVVEAVPWLPSRVRTL